MPGKKSIKLDWRVHTPSLLKEIGNHNPSMAAMRQPLRILSSLLIKVGERASKLNDPELNELMVRLTIYSIADPSSHDYNPDAVKKILEGKKSKYDRTEKYFRKGTKICPYCKTRLKFEQLHGVMITRHTDGIRVYVALCDKENKTYLVKV